MSEYSLYDFTESLGKVEELEIESVVKAWGYSPEGYGSWEGGFVLKLRDGRYAYLSGGCCTSGWGCQDDAEITFSDSLEGLDLPAVSPLYGGREPIEWDEYPADLNLWLKSGSPDPDEL